MLPKVTLTFLGGSIYLHWCPRDELVLRSDGDAVGGSRLKPLEDDRRLTADGSRLQLRPFVPNGLIGQLVADDRAWS